MQSCHTYQIRSLVAAASHHGFEDGDITLREYGDIGGFLSQAPTILMLLGEPSRPPKITKLWE